MTRYRFIDIERICDELGIIGRWYSGLMYFQARLESSEDGTFVATCADPQASARGLSPASALERLRAEIRYRIELCPCSSVDDEFVELQVVGPG